MENRNLEILLSSFHLPSSIFYLPSFNPMPEIYEIRIHARAGQGAKSAAHLIATAAFRAGKYVQAFPSYGPERMGAPMDAYVRLSDTPLRRHSNIIEADLAIVIDASLIVDPAVTGALRPGGQVVVNSSLPAAALLSRINTQCRLLTVDASGISREVFGKDLPNTAMIAAANRAVGFVPRESLHAAVAEFFTKKYNQSIGEKNITAMIRAEEGFK